MREFIKTLAGEGVQLYLEGEKLKLRLFKKGAEEAFLDAIRHNHEQLVSYLKKSASAQLPVAAARPKVQRQAREHNRVTASFAQQRLWFLDQIDGDSAHYNMPTVLKVAGCFDTAIAGLAFQRIIERHEPLRTVFANEGGQLSQLIREQPGFGIKVIDLRHLDAVAREQSAQELAAADGRLPFDLASDVMVRASFIRLGDEEGLLLFCMHHIASDGWSMGLLVREFIGQYQALRSGADNPYGPLAVRYADYALWQRNWLSGAVLEQQLGYWTRQLAELPPVHSLPLDHARPLHQSFRGAQQRFVVDMGTCRTLKKIAQDSQATLFMVLHGALSILLARHSNSADIVVGTPVANRLQKELEEIIGFFVNTLVLRTDVSGNPRFDEFLEQVRMVNLDAQSHQDVPFEYLVERINPQRSTQYSPLFQIMFSMGMESPRAAPVRLDEVDFSAVVSKDTPVKFDLEFDVTETAQGLVCQIDYNADLFEARTIAQLAGQYGLLLQGIAADPRARLYELPMLDQTERHHLLHTLNATEAAYSLDQCAHQLFEAQAEKNPDQVALVCDGQTLTYRQLNERANRLAHYLMNERGVLPDSQVGICIDRSLDMIVAMLGILKAGGAYVPLDPAYPEARLAYMVADARLDTVLTQRALVERKVVDAALALCLDDEAVQDQLTAQGAGSVAPPAMGLSPCSLAYIIYTSGSTGNPKGVMIEHASLVNLAWSIRRRLDLTGAESMLQFSTINFDLSIADIFGALCNGSRLVLRTDSWPQSPEQFWERCAALDINILCLPTAYWHELAKDSRAAPPPCIRQINIGGEQVNRAMISEWYKRADNVRIVLHNVYGPTECTVDTTVVQLVEGVSNIGKPIENYSLYVLGPAMSLVPAGAPGELYVGGVGLARGYLHRPDLTAERFVVNPFHDAHRRQSSSRLYKTGDLVRYLADGNLEFLGRADGQVKIRGFRIELGEIESQLAEHEAVGIAAVVARDSNSGEKRLVAYLTPKDGAEPDQSLAAELKAYLKQLMPEYMVPSAWVVLAALPLTPNGKVDAKALPAPDAGLWQPAYVAPRNDAERTMAEIWADMLQVERVGIHDNFFELGGHSLLAIGLIDRMHEAGLVTTVRALFSMPTIADVVDTLGRREHTVEVLPNLIPAGCQAIGPELLPLVELSQQEIDGIVMAVPGGAANVQDIYPLGPLQEGILFHHLLQQQGDVYLLPMLLAFDGRATLDAFVAALQQVIARHDVLRTSVVWEGLREPVQVVWRDAPALIVDVSFAPLDGDIAAQMDARYDPAHYRIDVRQAPLTHAFAAHDPVNGRWLLKIIQHHLVSDHATLEIIIGEIRTILANEASPLPSPVPFRQFVAQARLGVSRNEHEAFFREMLADIDEPTTPFGLADVQGNGRDVREATQIIGAELAGKLRREASRLRVSAASLIHLAWAQVLSRLTGRRDVVFGTVLFGRMRGGEKVAQVPGVFINTLPIRLAVGQQEVAQSLRRTHELLTRLVHHEHAPLALAQRCSSVEAPSPLFTSLLNYRHTAPGQTGGGDAAWRGIQTLSTEERNNYPVTLSVDDFGDDFMLTAQLSVQAEPGRICAYMQTALENLVQALEQAPHTPVAAVEVLPPQEREQLLVEWNDTAQAYAQDQTLHGLFRQQAARTPERVAVLCEDRQLSYRELDERSERLAHYLRGQGVGRESLVAICVERDLDMLVGLLGILKAGGAYVPLDPGYPKERLAYMLEDARPALLLTQQSLLGLLSADVVTVCLDGGWEAAVGSGLAPDGGATADQLAYVIYTSGSTGQPKGVGVTHGNVNSFLHAMRGQPGIAADDVLLAVTPLSFDIAGLELFLPLSVGAATVIAPRQVAADPAQLARHIARHGVTMMQATPSTWRMLVEQGWQYEGQPLKPFKLLCGGEALSAALAEELLRRVPVVWNMYGPTETTIWSSLCAITDLEHGIPIGRPIANTQIYLLDGQSRPVPVGVAGEVHIAGAGVARGYVNRDELTAERFVPNPFGAPDAHMSRMYKTGDLARYLPDGRIEYLGRIDQQVKLRGFRIELGEIETWLARHAAVREAVVVAREDSPGDQRLVAYLTTHEGSADAGQLLPQLKAYLAGALPEHMVPSAWMVLDQLPLTANGKINRKALPAPDGGLLRAEYVAAQTDTEERLVALWRELLNVERVGIHDNFFDLGGHSLLIIRLHVLIMQYFQKSLSVVDLFRYPTIEKLAGALDRSPSAAAADAESLERGQHRRQTMQRRSAARSK